MSFTGSDTLQWHFSYTLFILGEEENSTIRINAEESLNRIVKHCESSNNIIRIHIDCYHEIKKNGHEKWVLKWYQLHKHAKFEM